MDSKTKILTLDHADTIRNFVNYSDGIVKKDLTKYIDDNINSEATARQNADNELDIKIDTKISEEATTRQNADNALDAKIDTKISEEANARQNADNALDDKIDTEISEEANARQNADNALDDKIVDEEAARKNQCETLQRNIDNEATTRQNDDKTLNLKIVDEANARQNADNALDNRTKTLESSVNTLNGKVNNLEESYDNLTGEIGDINTQLKDELLIEINNKITAAKGEVSEEYNTKVETLTEELNALIAESSEANQGKIKEIQSALSTLEGDTNNKLSALDSLRENLKSLSDDVDNLEIGIKNGEVFTDGQLDELIKTVMIDEVSFDENTIEAPTIFSTNIVSLIAKFGQINASKIIGGDISGHTIKSNSTVDDENSDFNGKPTWELHNDGSGHLALGNISWNKEGNVTFGEDVKLSWNNVTDAPSSMSEERITEITNNAISTAKISATQIDTDNLVVKKLDTKPNEENTLTTNQVRIQDNEITVTGKTVNNPVIKIIGTEVGDNFKDTIEPTNRSITFNQPDSTTFTISNIATEQKFEIGSFNISNGGNDVNADISSKMRLYNEDGIACTLKIKDYSQTNFNSRANINGGSTNPDLNGDTTGDYSITEMSFAGFNIGIRCIVTKNDIKEAEYTYHAKSIDLHGTSAGGYFIDPRTLNNMGGTYKINIPFDTICERKYYGTDYVRKFYLVISGIGTSSNLLGATISFDIWSAGNNGSKINYNEKHLITNMPKMNMYTDCLRYFIDDYNYFDINDEGYLTYYAPGKVSGFGVDRKDGVWFIVGGEKIPLYTLHDNLNTLHAASNAVKESTITISTKYNNLNTVVNGDGTTENPGLVNRTNGVEELMYGKGGSASEPTTNSLITKTTTIDTNLTALESKAIVNDGDGVNSFSTVFNNAAKSFDFTSAGNVSFINVKTDATNAQSAAQNAIDRVAAAETSITTLNINTVKKTVTDNFTVGEPSEPISIVYVEPGKFPETLNIQHSTFDVEDDNYTWVPGQVLVGSSIPGYISITSNTLTQLLDDVPLYITNIKQGKIIYKPVGFDLIPVTKNINGSDVTTYSNTFEITVYQLKEGVIVPFEVYDLSNIDGNISIANIKFKLAQ